MYRYTDTYSEHERSSYANANGCADHDTNSECDAFRAAYADAYAEFDPDTTYSRAYDAGYSDGERDGHCCNHS